MEQQEARGRERILAAARRLFVTSGFHQAPMSELSSIAGVSVGQIYRLFASKTDVIAAIVEEDTLLRLDELRRCAAMVEAGEGTIAEALQDLVRQTMSHREEGLSFEILAEAHRDDAVARTVASFCELYRNELRRIVDIANPALDEQQVRAAEEMLLACLFGLGHRSLSRPRLSKEETAIRVGQMMLLALRGTAE